MAVIRCPHGSDDTSCSSTGSDHTDKSVTPHATFTLRVESPSLNALTIRNGPQGDQLVENQGCEPCLQAIPMSQRKFPKSMKSTAKRLLVTQHIRLGGWDSNPNPPIKSRLCCRYTTTITYLALAFNFLERVQRLELCYPDWKSGASPSRLHPRVGGLLCPTLGMHFRFKVDMLDPSETFLSEPPSSR